MKAILVIDMPKECCECPCFYDYLCCQAKDGVNVLGDERPSECPLKPMPNYIPTPYLFRQMQIADGLQNADGSVPTYSEDYMNGWNDCIDEILGEDK